MIDIISWEKTVAEISVPCSGMQTANEQDIGTHRTGVSMDDYWRTLLADITEQVGATFTHKTYIDFCTMFRKFTSIMSTYDTVKRYALTLSQCADTGRRSS
jgi:hypothetical protein